MAGGKKDFLSSNLGIFVGAMFACFLWGSASPCVKLGYQMFQIPADAVTSQLLFAGIRLTIAGLMTILFGSLLSHQLLLPQKGSGGMLLILAMTQSVAQYFFFYLGMSKAPGFKGAISTSTSVFFAVLISSLILHQEKLTIRKLLGCIIGFAGIIVLNLDKAGGDSGFRLDGEGFLLLAAFSYACATVLIKRFSKRENPVTLSGWQFLIGGTIMTAVALLLGGEIHPTGFTSWLLLLYMAFISSAAYMIWALLLERHPVSRVTVYSFANPVFGVLLSALILGEGKQLNIVHCLMALVLVCAGIWAVNSGEE